MIKIKGIYQGQYVDVEINDTSRNRLVADFAKQNGFIGAIFTTPKLRVIK